MESKRKKRIWLVGGETGGHIMPLLAVAEVLKKDSALTITYLGEKSGPEYDLAKQAGLKFEPISTGKLRRYLSLSSFFLNIGDLYRFTRGVVQSCRLIRKQKPVVIFSKGGPVALPVAVAGWLCKVPIVTHESDAVMGLTNRLIARFATRVLTGFSPMVYPANLARKITQVGIPIRSQFCRPHRKHRTSKRKMVLIMGGIQGSVAINNLMAAVLPQVLEKYAVMHITGERSYELFVDMKATLPAKLSEYYGVMAYTPHLAEFIAEADMVISRAGSAIFEVASMGKPMLLIPLPSAANNHQVKNAEIFAHYKAAYMLIQDNLTPETLYETIELVLDDASLRHELQEGTRHFVSCDAAKKVADILKQTI